MLIGTAGETFIIPTLVNLRNKFKYLLRIVQNYSDWYSILLNRLLNRQIKKVKLRDGTVIQGGPKSLILDLVDEIFIEKVYNPKFLAIGVNDSVVDIGANIGVFSLYAAKKGAAHIYSIEPLPENIPYIKKNFKTNHLGLPKIIEAAVSDKQGKERLYLGDLDSHGLLFDRNAPQKFQDYIAVKTTSLKSILKSLKINRIDFLKIDCEGGEGKIVNSISKDVWIKIKKISIEYHDDVSLLSHQKIVEKLKKAGFTTSIKITGKLFGYIYAWRD